jgi:hypothetical protein
LTSELGALLVKKAGIGRIISIAAVLIPITVLAKILGHFWALQIDQRETMVSNNEQCIKE